MKLVERMLAACGLAAVLALGAGGAAVAQDAKLPDGKVGIHYYRADGNYSGWGLHAWESFQKKDEAGNPDAKKEGTDRTVGTISWMAPMKPTGKDDFGLFWHLPADEFSNGRVNYIIHKGDTKDQCGKDMFFVMSEAKEIWVNAGDCNVYKSKEDAIKARK